MMRLLTRSLDRKKLGQKLLALHRDEQGAEGLEKLLIVAAIVLPLLGVLIFFMDEIVNWVTESWDTVRGNAADPDANPF